MQKSYTPLEAFNLVNSLIFPSAREVHTLLHLLMLANNWSPPHLRLSALTSWTSHKMVKNEIQIE